MKKPYVISAELDLMGGATDKGIQISQLDAFREDLDADLRNCDKQTVWVPSEQLRRGIEGYCGSTILPAVSLDDRYLKTADAYLGISRGIDTSFNDAGYTARSGYPDIGRQLDSVAGIGREIVLADDVLFSGEMALNIIMALGERNVQVRGFICGIGIGEGIDKLTAEGIDVNCVQSFEDVEDEICERDFAVIRGSGRKVVSLDAHALYFDSTYGRPSSWASIPESKAGEFCLSSVRRNIDLMDPNVLMQSIGTFIGYDPRQTAIKALQKRMGAEQ